MRCTEPETTVAAYELIAATLTKVLARHPSGLSERGAARAIIVKMLLLMKGVLPTGNDHSQFTDVFQRKGDGRWKIVHEHVSMPPAPTSAP